MLGTIESDVEIIECFRQVIQRCHPRVFVDTQIDPEGLLTLSDSTRYTFHACFCPLNRCHIPCKVGTDC